MTVTYGYDAFSAGRTTDGKRNSMTDGSGSTTSLYAMCAGG